MGSVDDYFEGLDEGSRAAFERVRRLALEASPDAEQGRSYGVVALMHAGRPLVGFYAGKKYLSIYPYSGKAVDAVRNRLAGFHSAGGTIGFTPESQLPDDVVRDLLAFRIAEIERRR